MIKVIRIVLLLIVSGKIQVSAAQQNKSNCWMLEQVSVNDTVKQAACALVLYDDNSCSSYCPELKEINRGGRWKLVFDNAIEVQAPGSEPVSYTIIARQDGTMIAEAMVKGQKLSLVFERRFFSEEY